MVSQVEYSLATDLLAQADLPLDKPIRTISEHQAKVLMQATDPVATNRYSAYNTARARQGWINALYYMGFQSLEPPEVLENVDPGLLLQDAGYVANHLVRIIQGNVARKAQARPDWECVPMTPDQPDQDGAKVGTSLLGHAWEHLQLDRHNLELNLQLELFGTAFYYTNWNANAGKKRRIYLDPTAEVERPIDAKMLSPEQRQWLEANDYAQDVREGDYDFELLNTYQVFVIPRYTVLRKMPWVRIDRTMSVAEVWNRWPKEAKKLTREDIGQQRSIEYWQRISTLTSRPAEARMRDAVWNDALRVSEIWIPPSERIPAGRTIYRVGDKIMENEDHLLAADDIDLPFPIVDFHNIRVPGRFHSMSTIEHLLGPQREYNRGRHQLNLQRDFHGTPQWIAARGSLSGKPLRNEFGDVWEYDKNSSPPILVNPPAVAPATVESVAAAVNDMQMIAAQSDPTQGRAPKDVRSGVALRALQERDQLVIGPAITDLEKGYEQTGRNLLLIAHKKMTIPRAIHIYGETRQADIVLFRGADLNGNSHVRVRSGSMMPKSKAETMEMVLELLQLGALVPNANAQDRRTVYKALEIGGVDKMFLEEDLDRRRAGHENMMFSRPSPDPMFAYPGVDVDDDHQAHIEEHLKFKKTDEFERLPPMRKQLFNAHVMEHKMAIADAMAGMMAAQQAMAGGVAAPGAGPGGGSPPRETGKPSPPKRETGGSEKAA